MTEIFPRWGRPVVIPVDENGAALGTLANPLVTTGGSGGGGGGGASEFHLGEVGGNTGVVAATPVVTAAAYAAGNVIGTKLTLPGLARLAGGTGVIQTADVFLKVANAVPIDLLVFHADPSASTFTDRAALALAAADFDKLSGVIHVTDWTSCGTPSLGQALGVGMAFKLPAGATDGYLVAVARGAVTFASTSDVKIAVKSLRD